MLLISVRFANNILQHLVIEYYEISRIQECYDCIFIKKDDKYSVMTFGGDDLVLWQVLSDLKHAGKHCQKEHALKFIEETWLNRLLAMLL
jgi:hypothetical protein